MIEYVAAMKLESDGDWHIDEPAGSLYYGMDYDGGYDKRVKVFTDALEAWDFLIELAKSLSEGLGRSRELDEYDKKYPRSLENLSRLMGAVRNEQRIKGMAETFSRTEMEQGCISPDDGGFAFSYETGNWSWSAAFMIRANGLVGEMQWCWVDGEEGNVYEMPEI